MLKENSTLRYVLKGLIPYTDANLKLSYSPNKFFNELEKLSKNQTGRSISHASIRNTYYRAKKQNYFEVNDKGHPKLTELGNIKLSHFVPKKLKGAKLLVTFDIEEKLRYKRRLLRQVLISLKFTQIQQSVWISDYDGREILIREIEFLKIKNNVDIYEARII